MTKATHIRDLEAQLPSHGSKYPDVFQARVQGRKKCRVGDHFGLNTFGVNVTRLLPGSASALRHAHTVQDEFVYIVEGNPVLVTDAGEQALSPGMCVGFAHGTGDAHHLVNRGPVDVVYLEIGDRLPGDSATYPDDDLKIELLAKGMRYTRKDGTPY